MGSRRSLKEELSFKLEPQEPENQTRIEEIAENLRPRRFLRVPTHAIGVAKDRRRSPRALLSLPLRLTRIGERSEPTPVTLVTKNISSTGVYFLAPRRIEPGTSIELEVALVERPFGRGSVSLRTAAHVIRIEQCEVPGWEGYAASFDDFDFQRDDLVPLRFAAS